LILTSYMAIVVGASIAFEDKPLILVSIVAPLTILLLIACAKTTRGGWCWRWGSRD
jgi:hypothetical protein